CSSLFFFQAEDGIRVFHVTGVQTCALPIWTGTPRRALMIGSGQSARTLLDALHSEAPDDYTIVGMVAEPGSDPPADPQIPVIADGRDLPRVARQADVSELILAYEQEPSGELFQEIGRAHV